MRRRSTGYVAAKIRANTARRNGSSGQRGYARRLVDAVNDLLRPRGFKFEGGVLEVDDWSAPMQADVNLHKSDASGAIVGGPLRFAMQIHLMPRTRAVLFPAGMGLAQPEVGVGLEGSVKEDAARVVQAVTENLSHLAPLNMQQAKRDAAQIMRWRAEDGGYLGSDVDCFALALLHQMFEIPVTRGDNLELIETLDGASDRSAIASAYSLAQDKAMREVSRSR